MPQNELNIDKANIKHSDFLLIKKLLTKISDSSLLSKSISKIKIGRIKS
jgi:hypothetical protein